MFNWLKKTEKRTLTIKDLPSYQLYPGYHGNDSGIMVSEEVALQVIGLRACIDFIAQSIATLSLHVYQRTEEGRSLAYKHQYYNLLHNAPSNLMTKPVWLHTLMIRTLLFGNSYDYIDRRGNKIVGLVPMINNKVKPFLKDGRVWYQYTWNDGSTSILQDKDVLHVYGMSLDGIQGRNPIQDAARTIGTAVAGTKVAAKSFADTLKISWIFKTATTMDEPAQKRFKDGIMSSLGGTENSFGMLICEDGLEPVKQVIDNEAMQFVELVKEVGLRDMCRLFHVPSHMVNDLEKGAASFASIEQQAISYYKNTVAPWLAKIEAEINRKIFENSTDYYAEFDVSSLLKGDLAAQDASFSTGVQYGWYSINEVRQAKNKPPIEGGDYHYRPTNMFLVQDDINKPTEEKPTEDNSNRMIAYERVEPENKTDLSAIYRNTANRLATKEIKAIERAVKKYDDAEELYNYCKTWFDSHEELVKTSYSAVLRADNKENQQDIYTKKHTSERLLELKSLLNDENWKDNLIENINTWRETL